ncbi:MAG: hypothetical protein ACLFR1_14785 [Spirochaetia bacterium]
MGLLILGIVLIVYGVFCVFIGAVKFSPVWNMGKIQGFVKMLGEIGTQIFLVVWGLIAAGIGIWLVVM